MVMSYYTDFLKYKRMINVIGRLVTFLSRIRGVEYHLNLIIIYKKSNSLDIKSNIISKLNKYYIKNIRWQSKQSIYNQQNIILDNNIHVLEEDLLGLLGYYEREVHYITSELSSEYKFYF